VLVILVVAACLGFFSFMEMIDSRQAEGRSDAVRKTVSITTFLLAVTSMFQRSGALPCMLLLLLARLIDGVAARSSIHSRVLNLFRGFVSCFCLGMCFL
jgi:hypothetical protein